MNELSVRDGLLDLRYVENVKWSIICPPVQALAAGYLLHYDAQEISWVPAFGEDLVPNLVTIQTASAKIVASKPYIQQSQAIRSGLQAPERRCDAKKHVSLCPVQRELSR